ncbi:hypothetical protein PTTG_27055 [Puccinia triticina 1-1 BBBD Race 1]|uniref:Uncharacterized protein n=1 Tax=Puccinia triticina (isolate 1-1 / race 1 (BBBD)) TaxID=630390 RepID=A0A180GN98_PUCT1|nr:hypothetical protein PTTG_27055 [Puccinia triticina 1-1 BBBD Race 1]
MGPPQGMYNNTIFANISSKTTYGVANRTRAGRGAHGGAGGGGGRGGKIWDQNAERQKNLDTFGELALNPNLGLRIQRLRLRRRLLDGADAMVAKALIGWGRLEAP